MVHQRTTSSIALRRTLAYGPWTFGVVTRRGQRTDLETAVEMIKDGAHLREVAMKCSEAFVKFHKGLTALDTLVRSNGPRDIVATGPEVWVFWGPTGLASRVRHTSSGPMLTVRQRVTSGGMAIVDKILS